MYGSRLASRARRARRRLRADRRQFQAKELCEPGHVPTPPRPPTGFARGRLSPQSRPQLFDIELLSTRLIRCARALEFATDLRAHCIDAHAQQLRERGATLECALAQIERAYLGPRLLYHFAFIVDLLVAQGAFGFLLQLEASF